MILQIGKSFSKCFGLKMYLDDAVYTELMCGDHPVGAGMRYDYIPTEEESREYRAAGDKIVDYEIFIDTGKRNILNIHHGHNNFNWKIRYDEPYPNFVWELTSEQDEILGYSCYKAKCAYGGRKWSVWFAPEIPINGGPWKFLGLPGLILKAIDHSRQYLFTCMQVERRKEPIYFYEVPTTLVTKEKYRQYEKSMHESPCDVLGNGGEWKFYYNGTELDSHWSIPYNPIELE